ncbi:MAG: protein kinase [Oscillospiraceae bacterium]|nr:protein kinase [Oscillospiraceae bacterium]
MATYTDIDFLDCEKNILLTKSSADNTVYVKKYISADRAEIYKSIQRRRFYGVPRVIDIYPENDYFVLIEEYICGKSLRQMLDGGYDFTIDFVKRLVYFLCKTLSPIHKYGIVHRDITAANVLYSDSGEFYLTDFGNARIHKQNQSTDTEFIGTQDYAAPEQFGFGQSDRRTDIYAIGVLMNVLLTGGKFPTEQKYRGSLSRVIKRCTAVKPRDRYASVSRLRHGTLAASHKVLLSVTCALLCLAALTAYCVAVSTSADRYSYTAKPIETSSPAEKAYRRWSDIENLIADGEYAEAQQRLDAAVADGLTGYNIYILYSANYEAQGMYDNAVTVLIDYINDIYGTENLVESSPIYIRLEYLYPNCSDGVKQEIDKIFQPLN